MMKHILDQMEEHIAEIRNLQRNFDYHSKRLEKLMRALDELHQGAASEQTGRAQETDSGRPVSQ